MRNVHIHHLVDQPDVADLLERWFIAEWAPWYGPDGEGDAAADLAECGSKDALPLCLVAFSDTGDVLGTAALKADSLGADIAPGPWLSALYVAPSHRHHGVAAALVAAIEDAAARLGYDALYISTHTADRIVQRRGWTLIGTATSLRGRLGVYRLDLE